MSRTYRRYFLHLDCNCGAPVEPRFSWNKGKRTDSVSLELQKSSSWGVPPTRICNCGYKYDYYSKRNLKRDKKAFDKAPKWYKAMKWRERKAKETNVMRHGNYSLIPLFKMSNQRDWT